MKELNGTGVAMITPFTADNQVDFTAIEQLVEGYIAAGIDFLVVLGTTAETATLSPLEQTQIAAKVAAVTKGRIPLVLGKGGNNTLALVRRIQSTDFTGYSAILSVCPYYNRPNQEGIFQHFSAVAQASPLPVILYNVPSRTGATIDNTTVIRLAEHHKNIIGIKDATGDLVQGKALIEALPKDFLVTSGDDATALELVAAGGCGAISVIAGAFPDVFSSMLHLAKNNDFIQAKALESLLAELTELIFKEGNPTGLKALMHLQNKCENHLRLPLVPASSSLQREIEQALEAVTMKC
ncbi:MAG: 4-hydroxy-tetrahydrodipicolinate synthase [Flavobacteriaceae bacterium]